MKKVKIGVMAITMILLGLGSCIEHEVIPAPVPQVDLFAEFTGTINGTNVNFTQNVNGYAIENTKAKILLPTPALSSAVYYSEMLSPETTVAIKIGLGSAQWDNSTAQDPTLEIFNNFHLNNTTPLFSDNGTSGFEVTYRDGLGKIWKSSETSVNIQTVLFSEIKQESDASGDYSKFVCDFNCYVYRINDITLDLDSLPIQGGKFKGWFKR